jgi:hypothetical protein
MIDQDHRSGHPGEKARRLGSGRPLSNVAGSKKPFTVEKLRRRMAPSKVDADKLAPAANPAKNAPTDVPLNRAEQAARLGALTEAQMRAPEERLQAERVARREAECELASTIARCRKEIERANAERNLERNKVEQATTALSESEAAVIYNSPDARKHDAQGELS